MKQKMVLKNSQKTIKSRNSIKISSKGIDRLKKEISQYYDSNGYLSYSAKKKKYTILGTNSPKEGLVECPECKIGQLLVIRTLPCPFLIF